MGCLADSHGSLAVGGRELGGEFRDAASGVPATGQCRLRDGGSSFDTCWVSVPGRFRTSSLIVVQASSAAAKDAPAATVMAIGKPAAIVAGSSKAEPESPAARGRAATAIIWPRRESALLTAEAIPECRESTLARTVAVIGVISTPRPTPNTISGGNTPVRYLSPGWIRVISSSPAPA